MPISADLLINAIVAGLLLGGFYAAVTVGVSISFGILDIVNIAHPAFIILGSYIAYIVNTRLRRRSDPGQHRHAAGVLCARLGDLPGLLPLVREARAGIAARPRLLLRPAVRHRSHAAAGLRRRLPLRRGGAISARACISALSTFPLRMLVPCVVALVLFGGAGAVPVAHLHRPRHQCGGAGPGGAAADGGRPDPHQAHRLRHLDRHLRRSPARC